MGPEITESPIEANHVSPTRVSLTIYVLLQEISYYACDKMRIKSAIIHMRELGFVTPIAASEQIVHGP